MSKAVGTEIVDFYLNGWPEGYYSDESIFSVTEDGRIIREDGPENAPGLPVTEKYELDDFGLIIPERQVGGQAYSFAYFFNEWKKAQTTTTLVIKFDKSRDSLIRAALELNNIKIIS